MADSDEYPSKSGIAPRHGNYDHYAIRTPKGPHDKRVDLWVSDDDVHLHIFDEDSGQKTEIPAHHMELLVDAWLKRHPRPAGGK